ncbi:MAG TPA: choice-of-anchor D domain-containing protein [Myxococcota bacterium]|nr:choice-of-anchor D domain-containing protein [Myxococcota bacterium]
MWVTVGLLLSCEQDQQINVLVPELTLSPEALHFGEVVVDFTEEAVVEVINTGQAPLTAELAFAEFGGVYSVDPETLELPRGERAEIIVQFTPATYKDYDTELVFTTNIEDSPELGLSITGLGGDGPTPDIHLDPSSVDFDVVAPGDADTMWFTLKNQGDGDLLIGTTSQGGSGTFSILGDPAFQTIPPDGSTQVIVLYSPTTIDGDNGSLAITSNDPDEPEVIVTLLGNGGGDFDYPVAVIDGPDSVDPPETIGLDGSDSYDPGGWEITDYEWSLVVTPTGSGGKLQDTVGDATEAYFDIAGRYEVQLVVENELGVVSAPAKYSIDAVPTDAIHVEMIWDAAAADVDLHMLESEDASLFERPGDVCYCNPSPSWGSSGTEDDPTLDLDDIGGYGPENINIQTPADGDYPVRVHYFDHNGDGALTATVRFYLDGELFEEDSMVLSRNEVWNAGIIHWPAATVEAEDDAPYELEARGCD